MRTLLIWLIVLLASWLQIQVACSPREHERGACTMLLPSQPENGSPGRPPSPARKAVLADDTDREDEGSRLWLVPGNVPADVTRRGAGSTSGSLFEGLLTRYNFSSPPLYLALRTLLI
jgi:hypothetical protein